MSDTRTHKGSKLYICTTPQPDNLNQAGYEALTWVQIIGVGRCGEFTVDENMVNYQLEQGGNLKAKGFSSFSDPEFEFATDYADAGQDGVRAAGLTDLSYAFKREKADKLNAAGNNTVIYAIGKVKRVMDVNGTGDDIIRQSSVLAIEYEPVKVEATAG